MGVSWRNYSARSVPFTGFVSTMSEQGAAKGSTRAYGWRAIVICDVRGNLLAGSSSW